MKPVTLALLMWTLATAAGGAEPAVLQHGKALFDHWCAGCHAGTNRWGGLPAGTYALEQRYRGSLPADLEKRTDLKPAYIREVVREGVNVMPRTRKTEISDADLDALTTYLTGAGK